MKHCPECNKNYADPTLSYCLNDGAALIYGPAVEEPPTVVLSGDLPSEAPTRAIDSNTTAPSQSRNETALISGTEPPTAVLPVEPSEARTRQKLSDRTAEEVAPAKTVSNALGSRPWLLPAMVVLIVVGGGYLAYRYFLSAATTASRPIDSVAVLPFLNKSGNPDSEYLSDGLSESLVYRLSQLPDLKVSPPSTVARYKGTDVDPVRAGNELGVSAVVRGKIVERDGNLTVSAELIDVRQNKLIWGEQFDRKMSDLLSTQREIAREIASNLKLKVSGNETGLAKHYTESNEAYQLYLKARFHWAKRTVEGSKKTIEYLNQAIEKDPGFALAYAGLSDAYSVPNISIAPNEVMPKAKAAALKALQLDDTLAEAHTSLGRVLAAYDWDWAGAEREFKRAIELNPRYALAHEWYGGYLAAVGQLDKSLAERKIAFELDPLAPIVSMEMGQTLFWLRDYEQAIEQFQKAIELDPNLPATYVYLPAVYEQLGRYDEAVAWFQKMPAKQGNEWAFAVGSLGHLYAITGRKQEAYVQIEQLERSSATQYIPAPALALVYEGLGEKDQAFAWLEKGIQQRTFQLQWLKVDPRWDGLRSDPRFADLIRRMGLPQ